MSWEEIKNRIERAIPNLYIEGISFNVIFDNPIELRTAIIMQYMGTDCYIMLKDVNQEDFKDKWKLENIILAMKDQIENDEMLYDSDNYGVA